MWENTAEMEKDMQNSKVYAVLFAIFSTNLLISIILTINTSPGTIPEETEWDMPSATENPETLKAQADALNVILGRDDSIKPEDLVVRDSALSNMLDEHNRKVKQQE